MKISLEEKFKNIVPKVISPSYQLFSAVSLPIIRIGDEDHIIFEIRSSRLRHQPGEVSLPGGRVEPGEDSLDTAIREFCEELETDESNIHIVAKIFDYATPNRGFIHCYLARVDEDLDLSIRNDEVDRLFTVPLSFFKDTEPISFTNTVRIEPDTKLIKSGILDKLRIFNKNTSPYDWPKLSYEIPFYVYNDYLIWGITANIVKNFIEMM